MNNIFPFSNETNGENTKQAFEKFVLLSKKCEDV